MSIKIESGSRRGERMKRAAMMVAMLGISVWSLGQSTNKPATPSGQTTPAAGQAAAGAGQTAPAAGQAAAAPQGKRPPQAKTKEEYEAYNVAKVLTDPAAQEKAANEFAVKFPDSELRMVLYEAAMHGFQQANDADKMLEMARKVLSYDADQPEALLGAAQVLAERTHDTDLDKDQRLDEAKKDAQHALVTVETDIPTAGLPADKVELYKAFLRSEAFSIIGTIEYNAKAWTDAEGDLRKSIDAFPQQVDPVAVLRLSLTLDQQKKYVEALKFANQAVELTQATTSAGKAAREEKDRLTQLNSGTAPGTTPAPK
jgi:tetratricopeptide (TPR) repeat protein